MGGISWVESSMLLTFADSGLVLPCPCFCSHLTRGEDLCPEARSETRFLIPGSSRTSRNYRSYWPNGRPRRKGKASSVPR